MRKRVYIETTIVSYLTARPSRDLVIAANQEITREWWDGRRALYDLYTSQFVLDEAGQGDPQAAEKRLEVLKDIPLLDTTEDIMGLAGDLVAKRLLPQRAGTDAVHLAHAVVHRMDVLLTWNCRHLANADVLLPAAKFLRDRGHAVPLVCGPSQLMGFDSAEL